MSNGDDNILQEGLFSKRSVSARVFKNWRIRRIVLRRATTLRLAMIEWYLPPEAAKGPAFRGSLALDEQTVLTTSRPYLSVRNQKLGLELRLRLVDMSLTNYRGERGKYTDTQFDLWVRAIQSCIGYEQSRPVGTSNLTQEEDAAADVAETMEALRQLRVQQEEARQAAERAGEGRAQEALRFREEGAVGVGGSGNAAERAAERAAELASEAHRLRMQQTEEGESHAASTSQATPPAAAAAAEPDKERQPPELRYQGYPGTRQEWLEWWPYAAERAALVAEAEAANGSGGEGRGGAPLLPLLGHDTLEVIAFAMADPCHPHLCAGLSATCRALRGPMLRPLAQLREQYSEARNLANRVTYRLADGPYGPDMYTTTASELAAKGPHLDLGNLGLYPLQAHTLGVLGARGSLPKVRTLDLRCNFRREGARDGGKEGIEAMAQFAEGLHDGGGVWPRLAALDLSHCSLRAPAAAAFAEAAARGALPALESLRLGGNMIFDEGVVALAPPLARLRVFKELVLTCQFISDAGLEALLSAAGEDGAGFAALQKLGLESNALGARSIGALAVALRSRSAFRSLVEVALDRNNPARLTGEPIDIDSFHMTGVTWDPPEPPAEVGAAIGEVEAALRATAAERAAASEAPPPEGTRLNLRLNPSAQPGLLYLDVDASLRAAGVSNGAASYAYQE